MWLGETLQLCVESYLHLDINTMLSHMMFPAVTKTLHSIISVLVNFPRRLRVSSKLRFRRPRALISSALSRQKHSAWTLPRIIALTFACTLKLLMAHRLHIFNVRSNVVILHRRSTQLWPC